MHCAHVIVTKIVNCLNYKSKVTNHYRHKLHVRKCTFKYFIIMNFPISPYMECYILFKQGFNGHICVPIFTH